MKKKLINLLMLSTIIMSQMTLSLTALAVEIDTNESSGVVTESTTEDMSEETSSTEKERENTKETKAEVAIEPLENFKLNDFTFTDEESERLKDQTIMEVFSDEVTPRGTTMTVDIPEKVTFPLGSSAATKRRIIDDVATVRVDGKVVGPDAYAVDIGDSTVSYDDVNSNRAGFSQLYFQENKNLQNTYYVQIQALVDYESTLEFRQTLYGDSVGAYTLQSDGSSWNITGNNAKGSRDDLIQPDYANEDFYKIDIFRSESFNPIFIDEETVPLKSFTAQGHEKKGDVLTRWNQNNSVKKGDVVRTWIADPQASRLHSKRKVGGPGLSSEKDYADDGGYAYYEVTENGFIPFQGTALKVVQQDIQQSTTNKQLDEMVEKSFAEIPSNYEVNGFTYYPPRDKLGVKYGRISVTETVPKTNQKLERSYLAPFNVIEDQMNVELKQQDALVGVDASTLTAKNYLSKVYFGNTVQGSSYFTAEFVERPNTNQVGPQVTKIKVFENSNPSNYVIDETITNVKWGNSLATTTKADASLYESSVSMLDIDGKPVLRANEGTGLSTSGSLSTEPSLSVYRNNTTNKIHESKTVNKSQTPKKLMETWQSEFKDYKLEYGDVVNYTVPGEKGNTTVAARAEKVEKETSGFDSAYYELTKNGYRLMHVNQFTVKSEIPGFDINTTHEEMNKKAADQLNLPSGANKNDYRIEYASVDTATPGKKKTKMNVYEKLTTGGEFMTTYDVEYNVLQDNTMSVELKKQNAFLGVDANTLTAKNYLSKVYFGDREQYNTYFEAEFVERPNTNLVGEQKAKIKVYEKSNPNNFVIEESTTNVLWGNNIGTYRKSSTSFESSVSMLDINGKPVLRANESSGLSTHSNLNTEPNLKVYRNNDTKYLHEATTKNKSRTAKKLMETWQSEFDGYDLVYGDVISYTVPGQKGASTVAARQEQLKTETAGFDSAYYELTKDGYRLMRANQFTVNSTVPKFDVGTSLEEMNKTATSRLNLPANATASDYRIEYASVDTKTPGTKTTKMNVYEKLATGGEFMTTYDVSYEVVEVLEDMSIELQEVSIPVGTKTEFLNPNDFVKEVKLGDKKLNSSEYTASFSKVPDTSTVSVKTTPGDVRKSETKIQVVTNGTNQTVTETTAANITWNHTITTKTSSGTYTAAAISLLDNNDAPYLAANTGVFFSTSNLTFDPTVSAYRNNMNTPLISDGTNAGKDEQPKLTMNKWNETFETLDLKYGDVFGYTVNEENGDNSLGKRTWASRNEELVLETEGFDTAYYELTKDGYRLMRFNQFTVNDATLSFEIGTSKEEMDKVAANQLKLPEYADSKNYQIEYASVDTATPGTKTTKMNVYETLATGGKFMTTYDVQYNVSSVLTEKYVDDSGKELKIETQSLNSGQAYQPKPENYITIDGDTYIYQGWLTSSQTAGKDKPAEGNPPAVSNTTTYQYVYTKADNMINVTVPTDMVFGTYKSGSSTISSGKGVVKNNSKDVKTEVIMGEFKKEKSSVTLLKPGQSNSLVLKEKTARLNLTADNFSNRFRVKRISF